jgi:hypothetical protein
LQCIAHQLGSAIASEVTDRLFSEKDTKRTSQLPLIDIATWYYTHYGPHSKYQPLSITRVRYSSSATLHYPFVDHCPLHPANAHHMLVHIIEIVMKARPPPRVKVKVMYNQLQIQFRENGATLKHVHSCHILHHHCDPLIITCVWQHDIIVCGLVFVDDELFIGTSIGLVAVTQWFK